MIAASEVQKRWSKRIGYPLLGLVVFVYALHLTFPYRRLEDLISDKLGESYEVTGISVGPGWIPGHVVVRNLVMKTRPLRETEKPTELVVDELAFNVGLWALLHGEAHVALRARMGTGAISGTVALDGDDTIVEFETEVLPLATVPGIRAATGGVPLEGGLDAHLKLVLPKGKWKEAQGVVDLACTGCIIGDGVAKMRLSPTASVDDGLTLPKIKLGKITGKIDIAKGQGHIDKFETKSPDGELSIEGDIRFDDPFGHSQVTAYLRFKSSDALRTREPKMADLEGFLAVAGRRPDGYIGVRITGPMNHLAFQQSKVSPVLPKAPAVAAPPPVPAKPAPPAMANRPVVPPRPPSPAAESPAPPVSPEEERRSGILGINPASAIKDDVGVPMLRPHTQEPRTQEIETQEERAAQPAHEEPAPIEQHPAEPRPEEPTEQPSPEAPPPQPVESY